MNKALSRSKADFDFGAVRMLHFVYSDLENVTDFFDLLDDDKFNEALKMVDTFPNDIQEVFRNFVAIYRESLEEVEEMDEAEKEMWNNIDPWSGNSK